MLESRTHVSGAKEISKLGRQAFKIKRKGHIWTKWTRGLVFRPNFTNWFDFTIQSQSACKMLKKHVPALTFYDRGSKLAENQIRIEISHHPTYLGPHLVCHRWWGVPN